MSRKQRRKRVITTVTQRPLVVEPAAEAPFNVFEWQRNNVILSRKNSMCINHSTDIYTHIIEGMQKEPTSSPISHYRRIITDQATLIVSPRRSGKSWAISRAICNFPGNILVVSRNRRMLSSLNDTLVSYMQFNELTPGLYSYSENIGSEFSSDLWMRSSRVCSMASDELPTCVIFEEMRPSDFFCKAIEGTYSTLSSRNRTGKLPLIFITT